MQIGKAEAAQHLDMNKHIRRMPEDIHESKAFRLVEPFDPGRQKRRIGAQFGNRPGDRVVGIAFGRLDLQHLLGLCAAFGLLHQNRDSSTVRHRPLPEIPQHIGVKKDIRPAVFGHNETEAFRHIKPLHPPNNRFGRIAPLIRHLGWSSFSNGP